MNGNCYSFTQLGLVFHGSLANKSNGWEYFSQNYGPSGTIAKPEEWARCFSNGSVAHNLMIERYHRTIKDHGMSRKKRMDQACFDLIRIDNLYGRKSEYIKQGIQGAHKSSRLQRNFEGLHPDNNNYTVSNLENGYVVINGKTGSEYELRHNKLGCVQINCPVRCIKCSNPDTCAHSYVCSCLQFSLQNICKHLHVEATKTTPTLQASGSYGNYRVSNGSETNDPDPCIGFVRKASSTITPIEPESDVNDPDPPSRTSPGRSVLNPPTRTQPRSRKDDPDPSMDTDSGKNYPTQATNTTTMSETNGPALSTETEALRKHLNSNGSSPENLDRMKRRQIALNIVTQWKLDLESGKSLDDMLPVIERIEMAIVQGAIGKANDAFPKIDLKIKRERLPSIFPTRTNNSKKQNHSPTSDMKFPICDLIVECTGARIDDSPWIFLITYQLKDVLQALAKSTSVNRKGFLDNYEMAREVWEYALCKDVNDIHRNLSGYVQCDLCQSWFHCSCVNIQQERLEEDTEATLVLLEALGVKTSVHSFYLPFNLSC